MAPMLTWADDFDGPAGSAPGPWWTAEIGAGGDRELQAYRAGNAALDGLDPVAPGAPAAWDRLAREWTAANHVRAVAGMVAAGLLAAGLAG